MKKLLLLLTLFCTQIAFGVSDAEINKSLDQMEKSGMFTKEQLKAARDKLNSMSAQEKQAMVEEGKKKLNDPEIQRKAKEMLEKYQQAQKKQGQN